MTCARCGHCHCCGSDRAIQPPYVTTIHPYWLDYPLSPQPLGYATYA